MKRGVAFGVAVGLGVLTGAPLAGAHDASLFGEHDEVGFSLEEDWRTLWRRVLDRHGRADPVGPIQQRFPQVQRPEHEEAQALSEWALSDELEWARAGRGGRWWVHSYHALELGPRLQLKFDGLLDGDWWVRFRFDRLYNRSVESDVAQGDFVWMPSKKRGPYLAISYFPRIEKQDHDVGLSFGYRDPRYGNARLRLYALDVFSNGSYAIAVPSDPKEGQAVTRQTSLPLALALELDSVRVGGFRAEAYVGGVIPQHRELHLDRLTTLREQEESAFLFGGLLEYRVPGFPLWAGVTGYGFLTNWRDFDPADPGDEHTVHEQTYQTRVYMMTELAKNVRVETQIRYSLRPEQKSGPGGETKRYDWEAIYHVRTQWLMSRRVGMDLSYWRTLRQTEGPPDVQVDGRAMRFDVRCLLHFDRFLATFGVGFNPLPGDRSLYAGGGGNMVMLFE